jgi:hypothetical protein
MNIWKVAFVCCPVVLSALLTAPAALGAQASVVIESDSSLRELDGDGPIAKVSPSLRRAEPGLPRTAQVALGRKLPSRTDIERLGRLADAAELNPGNVSRSGMLHVVVGALVGSTAVVAGLWLFPSDEAILVPATFIPGAVGGAVIGGAVGWIVYRIRR